MAWYNPTTWFRDNQLKNTEIPLVESAGVNIGNVDSDDDQWTRLSMDGNRNLNPVQRYRMTKIAAFLWQTNLIANRLIELPLAYLLADGVSVSHNEPEHAEWLQAFWNDPINAMEKKLEKKARELAIFGEQFYPAFVNDMNGFVRLGYLDPSRVGKVLFDPDNAEQPIGVVTKRDANGKTIRYRVIINGPESVFSQSTQRLRETLDGGDIFYFNINSFAAFGRGNSDLTAQADFLDLYDDFIFGEGERAEALRQFVWDVTLKGADETKVNERAKEIQPPGPNSVNVHNDSEEWQALSPDLKTSDTESLSKLFKNHMLAGATMPPHWFSDGQDVNRANGEGMAEPTLKMLKMRQKVLKLMLVDICTYVLRQRHLVTSGDADTLTNPELYQINIDMPEMTNKDTTKVTASLTAVTTACTVMITNGLITEETAVRLIAIIVASLGVDIDPVEELDKAQEAAQTKKQDQSDDDTFVEPADDDE